MINRRKSAIDPRGFVLVLAALAWLAGILLDAWTLLPTAALLIGAALSLLSSIVCWRNHQVRLISLLTCLFLLGAWRYALASPVGDHTAISAFIGTKKLELTGSVTDEPKLQAHSRLLIVAVNEVSLDNGTTWQNAHGLVDVQMSGNAIDDPYGQQYGDDVELLGTLQPPSPTSGPDIFASMSFPRVSVNQSGGNPLIAALYRLRIYLATIITRLLPQPMAALLIAIVLSLLWILELHWSSCSGILEQRWFSFSLVSSRTWRKAHDLGGTPCSAGCPFRLSSCQPCRSCMRFSQPVPLFANLDDM